MLYQFTFMPTVYEYSGCLMFFQHLVLSLTFSPCVCVCVCDISLMTNNLEYLSYISIWISDVFAFSIEFSAFFLIIDEFLIFLNMRLLTELLVSWPTLVLPFHSLSGIFWWLEVLPFPHPCFTEIWLPNNYVFKVYVMFWYTTIKLINKSITTHNYQFLCV